MTLGCFLLLGNCVDFMNFQCNPSKNLAFPTLLWRRRRDLNPRAAYPFLLDFSTVFSARFLPNLGRKMRSTCRSRLTVWLIRGAYRCCTRSDNSTILRVGTLPEQGCPDRSRAKRNCAGADADHLWGIRVRLGTCWSACKAYFPNMERCGHLGNDTF